MNKKNILSILIAIIMSFSYLDPDVNTSEISDSKKLPSIVSDRKLIAFLIGGGIIAHLAFSKCAQGELKEPAFLIGIIIPGIILQIFESKKLRKIPFRDEKYPDFKKGNINLLILFLYVIAYSGSLFLCNYLMEAIGPTWSVLVNIIYFLSVFVLFINRISPDDNIEARERYPIH